MQSVLPPSPPISDDTPRSPYTFKPVDLTPAAPQHGTGSGTGSGGGRGGDNDDDWSHPHEVELANSTRMLSATIGALLTSFVVTPFDVVKTRLQAQVHPLHHADAAHPTAATAPSQHSSVYQSQPQSQHQPHQHQHQHQQLHHQPQQHHLQHHHHHHQPTPAPSHTTLHSHPSAYSSSIRPLAISITPHLSSSQLLERCSHVRPPNRLHGHLVQSLHHHCTPGSATGAGFVLQRVCTACGCCWCARWCCCC